MLRCVRCLLCAVRFDGCLLLLLGDRRVSLLFVGWLVLFVACGWLLSVACWSAFVVVCCMLVWCCVLLVLAVCCCLFVVWWWWCGVGSLSFGDCGCCLSVVVSMLFVVVS